MKEFTKDSILPISVGLLILIFGGLTTGVWTLAGRVHGWESRMESMESKLGSRWSYYMERESWSEFRRENPEITIPDVREIRSEYDGIFD